MADSYFKRGFRRFTKDALGEVAPTVIAILAILIVLLVQWRAGWVKVGEGWSTVFANLAPSVSIFAIYLLYHLGRTPFKLDAEAQRCISDQQKAISALEERIDRNKPDLHGRLEMILTGDATQNSTRTRKVMIVSIMTIGNFGLPSIVKGWTLQVSIPGGLVIKTAPTHVQGGPLSLGRTGLSPVILHEEDEIYEKVANHPIATGTEVTGHLIFMLENVALSSIIKGTEFKITFKDVANKEYFVNHVWGDEQMLDNFYIPGTKTHTQV